MAEIYNHVRPKDQHLPSRKSINVRTVYLSTLWYVFLDWMTRYVS